MYSHHSRKYSVNERFFDNWNPEMAYVLGFWFADGYMRKEKSYRISFTSNDREIIEQICDVMESSNPIRDNKRDKSLLLVIHSKKIYDKLIQLGGLRGKSLKMDFPKIPLVYIKDFIRGYFDGDGSVFYVNYLSTKDHKARKELRSNFTSGSIIFLNKLMNILYQYLGITKKQLKKYPNQGNSFKLGYGSKDTKKLLQFMYYPNFSIGLKRKAEFLIK